MTIRTKINELENVAAEKFEISHGQFISNVLEIACKEQLMFEKTYAYHDYVDISLNNDKKLNISYARRNTSRKLEIKCGDCGNYTENFTVEYDSDYHIQSCHANTVPMIEVGEPCTVNP